MGFKNADSERRIPRDPKFIQSYLKLSIMESLILAQDERWRRA